MHSNRSLKKNSPRLAIITAVISFFSALCPQTAPGATDPNLSVTIRRTNQNVVLQWFGSNAIPYQVESTSNLTAWANSSLVVTGAGGVLSFTNSIIGRPYAFYRLKRLTVAVGPSAVFNAGTGILTIIGDDFDNTIVVGRNAGGTILVNNGAVPFTGGNATVTNTVLIEVFGRNGHDELTIDQTGGAMPAAHLFGELGNDTLTGAAAIDDLVGGPGSDTLVGRSGNDQLFGDADNDTFVWNPGDGSDVIEGGIGQDTLTFNGSVIAEIIDMSANGARLRFTRNVANIVMDVDGVENVTYNALGGADIAIVNSLAGTTVTEVNVNLAGALGGTTGDAAVDVITLNGTPAPNTFNIAANAGVVEAGGLGALVRVVNGEGSNDVINIVGVGGDTVNINGSALADIMTVTAAGSNAQATATGFTIPVNVRGALTLAMNGLGGPDTVSCTGNLAALVPIVIDGGDDNDTLNGSNGADVILGGAGNDIVDGNQGNDTALLGGDNDTFQWDPGDGNDTVEGQAGTDTLLFNGSAIAEIIDLSANGSRLLFTRNVGNIVMDVNGVERVTWNAAGGADSTIVNNLAGTAVTEVNVNLAGALGGTTGDALVDVITLNGTAAPNTFNIAANAGAVEAGGLGALVRVVNAEGSNDVINIVGVGGDTVNINGSPLADTMTVAAVGSNALATATGFTIPVQVRGALTLAMNGLGGPDTVSCTGGLAAIVLIVIDGGDDNDTLSGSNGADVILGGAGNDIVDGNQGNDTALLGGENDTFVWDPGDGNDIVEGQAGADVLLFNGSAIAEIINLSANGSRLLFTRNVGNIVMDVNGVERVTWNAVGGADSTIINSLAGTAVTEVNVNLASSLGGATGDALVDVITVNGTAAADAFNMTASAGVVSVSGFIPVVRISHSEVANDDLIINGLGGVDVFNIGAGVAALIGVTTNQ